MIKISSQSWAATESILIHPAILKSEGKEYISLSDEDNIYHLSFWIKRKLGMRWAIPTSGVYSKTAITADKEKLFLDECCDFLRNEFKIHWIAHGRTWGLFNIAPNDAISAPFGSFRIDLNLGKEILWKNMHTKHKNVIRNAQKNKLTIQFDPSYSNDLYIIFKKMMARSGLEFIKKSTYNQIIHDLGNNVLIASVWNGDNLEGGAVIPFSEFSAFYFWGGRIEHPTLGAMNLLHWECMLLLKEKKCKTYDFVGARISPPKGSRREGIQRFKKRFGSVLYEGVIWKKIYSPFYYNLYKLLKLIITKGKYSKDIIDQELNKQQ